jgi:hypothetical protein
MAISTKNRLLLKQLEGSPTVQAHAVLGPDFNNGTITAFKVGKNVDPFGVFPVFKGVTFHSTCNSQAKAFENAFHSLITPTGIATPGVTIVLIEYFPL